MSDLKPGVGNIEQSNTVEELDDTVNDSDDPGKIPPVKTSIFSEVKLFECESCGKKCYYMSDYPYDICTDCNVKALEKKVKYLSARPSLDKLENYLRENFTEDDEVAIGIILDIIEDFQN